MLPVLVWSKIVRWLLNAVAICYFLVGLGVENLEFLELHSRITHNVNLEFVNFHHPGHPVMAVVSHGIGQMRAYGKMEFIELTVGPGSSEPTLNLGSHSIVRKHPPQTVTVWARFGNRV